MSQQVIENNQSEQPVNTEENTESNKPQWQEGEILKFVRVRFPGNAKSFPFLIGKKSFSYGQKVVAMSDRGMDVGYINSFPYEMPFNKSMLPIKTISKTASDEDLVQQRENIHRQKQAETTCNRFIEELKLDMVITHVEIIQFGKKMVFYFTAPARVDFRELVKRLVGELKTRIELRQITVRDRTAALGSIASCGQPTCCSTFLQSYGNVSVKMAKNQNLAMVPSKINGVCGQIKCCVKYENHVYTEKRKLLPSENSLVTAKNGDRGKVTKLHLFAEQFDMITTEGKLRRYYATQYSGKQEDPNWRLPHKFDTIVNETSEVIGKIKDIPQPQKTEDINEKRISINKDDTPTKQELSGNTKNEEQSNQSPRSDRENRPHNNRKNNHRKNNRNRNNRRHHNKNNSSKSNSSKKQS